MWAQLYNIEIKGVAGGNIEHTIMHDMAPGAGFQPSTVVQHVICSFL